MAVLVAVGYGSGRWLWLMGIVFRARNEHAQQCVFMRSRDIVVVAVPVAVATWS